VIVRRFQWHGRLIPSAASFRARGTRQHGDEVFDGRTWCAIQSEKSGGQRKSLGNVLPWRQAGLQISLDCDREIGFSSMTRRIVSTPSLAAWLRRTSSSRPTLNHFMK